MDANLAMDLVKTLGAFASMVNAYVAIRRERRELTERDKFLIVEAGDIRKVESRMDPRDINIAQALPRGIGIAAGKRLKRSYKRYLKAFSGPTSPFELDKEKEIAQSEICHTLALIKDHNNGRLPTKEWRDLWKSFACDEIDDDDDYDLENLDYK